MNMLTKRAFQSVYYEADQKVRIDTRGRKRLMTKHQETMIKTDKLRKKEYERAGQKVNEILSYRRGSEEG